jgi:hypothetical protein
MRWLGWFATLPFLCACVELKIDAKLTLSNATLAALHAASLAEAHASMQLQPPDQTEDGDYCGTGFLLEYEKLVLVMANTEDAQVRF